MCQLSVLLIGSGKTLVSVLLIKDKAGGLNINGQRRVTIFLAPKVLLVQQVLQIAHFALATSVDTFLCQTHQLHTHFCASKCCGCGPEGLGSL